MPAIQVEQDHCSILSFSKGTLHPSTRLKQAIKEQQETSDGNAALHRKQSLKGDITSIEVSHYFPEQYSQKNQDDTIEILDLRKENIAVFDKVVASGKYKIMHGQSHSIFSPHRARWDEGEWMFDLLQEVDKDFLNRIKFTLF